MRAMGAASFNLFTTQLECRLNSHATSHKEEARANVGIRPFPPRANLPPPETCGANVRHLDIIAVHGLGGNWLKTWEADDGAIWLRDRLPQLLAKHNIQARVLSYGYNTDFVFTNMDGDIERVAGVLLDRILSVRTTDEQKKTPLIFVTHNLGGIVVKAAFNKAKAEEDLYQNIIDRAAGCVFLGVPHRAANIAHWARNATATMDAQTGRRYEKTLWLISRSSEEWEKVGNVDSYFADHMASMTIGTVYDTKRTNGIMVADKHSATLGHFREIALGLPLSDHRDICRFGDSPDEGHRFHHLGVLVVRILVKSARWEEQ
ncbi:hypothetical protein MKX08_002938 [Trichoderma sp. CBMAI-0020]|nr:hypothetical protein MKX08_002938 [Trichoderma sp. CBMAI-0020]